MYGTGPVSHLNLKEIEHYCTTVLAQKAKEWNFETNI